MKYFFAYVVGGFGVLMCLSVIGAIIGIPLIMLAIDVSKYEPQ